MPSSLLAKEANECGDVVGVETYEMGPLRELNDWLLGLGIAMGWLRLVGSLKFYVSFAKEPYISDDILQKRPIISRSLLLVSEFRDLEASHSGHGGVLFRRLIS